MNSGLSDGFRVFVGVVLAALIAWRFMDRSRAPENQPVVGWLVFAGFVTGFVATGWVVAGAISLFVVLLIVTLSPLASLDFGEGERPARRLGPPTMGGPSRGGVRLPGAAVRDLRDAFKSGDKELMEETLSWWEDQGD